MPIGIYDRYPGASDGVDVEHRRCSKCREIKTLDGFSPDRRNKTYGLQAICKVCRKAREVAWREANPEEHKRRCAAHYLKHRERKDAYGREWRRKNADHVKRVKREQMLMGRYGLTEEEFTAIAASQNGACAVCRKPFGKSKKAPHTDHDHKTGLVRGILCGGCNIALGFFERPGFYAAATAYLAAHALAVQSREGSAA